MEYGELIKKRYACRNYNGKKISDELVMEILESGNLSQTALNLQQHSFGVISNEEEIKEISKLTYGQSYIEKASHLIILFSKGENFINPESKYVEELFKSRVTKERPLEYYTSIYKMMIKNTTALKYGLEQINYTASHLVNYATSVGVRSNIIAGFNGDAINEKYGIDKKDYYGGLIVCLGYSDEEIPNKSRRKLEENIVFKK